MIVVRSLTVLLIALFCSFLAFGSTLTMTTADEHDKEVVGKWEGLVTTAAGEMRMKLELRTEGDKIVGQITNPHGTWPITDVKFAHGKWTISWRTPDDATGQMIGSVKGDQLAGKWDFPPNFVGTFDFTKSK
jgi:hypothetical protein